jgi:hypothetical protein
LEANNPPVEVWYIYLYWWIICPQGIDTSTSGLLAPQCIDTSTGGLRGIDTLGANNPPVEVSIT